jgi:hypothetical protein
MWGCLRTHSGVTAVQDDAVEKPPRGGNRANRLILHALLQLCIPKHRWLALHSSAVVVPVHPHLVAEMVPARVHLAFAGREVPRAQLSLVYGAENGVVRE